MHALWAFHPRISFLVSPFLSVQTLSFTSVFHSRMYEKSQLYRCCCCCCCEPRVFASFRDAFMLVGFDALRTRQRKSPFLLLLLSTFLSLSILLLAALVYQSRLLNIYQHKCVLVLIYSLTMLSIFNEAPDPYTRQ